MAIPLQEYFDVLMRFARAPADSLDRTSGVDLNKVSALFGEGALLGVETSNLSDGKSWRRVSLSARGAVMLAEWQSLLERGTIRGRVMANVERALWALVGALLAVATRWIGG